MNTKLLALSLLAIIRLLMFIAQELLSIEVATNHPGITAAERQFYAIEKLADDAVRKLEKVQ